MRKLSGLLSIILIFGLLGCQDGIVDATPDDEPLTAEEVAARDTDDAPVQARYDADAHTVIIDAVVENEAVFAAVIIDPAISPPSERLNAHVFGAGGTDNPLVGLLRIEPGETENIVIPLVDDMPESTSQPDGKAGLIVSFHTDTHELGVFEHTLRVAPGRSFLLERDAPVVFDYTFTDEATNREFTQTLPLHAFMVIDV
ncbi:MAG: hypothetical protein AAF730_09515 [Bacteroidota bacterium]